MYFSIGNIFDEPLKDILGKGMYHFGKLTEKCLISEDKDFINRYVKKTYGQQLPVKIESILDTKTIEYTSKRNNNE